MSVPIQVPTNQVRIVSGMEHHSVIVFISFMLAALFALSGCSSDKPNDPGTPTTDRLAGGGRESDSDPFVGGPGDSGPVDSLPGLPDPNVEFFPVYFSQYGCAQQQPFEVLTNQHDWDEWWGYAVECSQGLGKRNYIPIPDSTITDSSWIGPDSLWPGKAPIVNFDESMIAIIKLEQGIAGRYIWIREFVDNEEEVTIYYEVSSPGDDCFGPLVDPNVLTIPMAAFVVPRRTNSVIGLVRENITYHCSWEPDPALPLTLYYTDAPCAELGAGEQIIRTEDEFKSWIEAAWQCDRDRWGNVGDSLIIFPDSTMIGDGPGTPPFGFAEMVDFTTHAVIILRADVQTAWGGGIWVNKFESTDASTKIEYSIMVPGEDCPAVGNGVNLRPTVAIRVPLPINEPVNWTRLVETISCDWVGDSTVVGGPR